VTPDLTLIVATRNRPESLRRLLTQLEFPRERNWELVVVDNGSADDQAELLQKTAASAGVRVVREPRRGKGNALNAGIEAARGELLVFSDDDIEPSPGWLEQLLAASQRHPDAEVFGGRILIRSQSVPGWIQRSRNLQEILLTEHDLGDEERQYPSNRFPLGPNMAVRRRALAGFAAPWDPQLGPGSSLPVGDERCFFCNIGQGGGCKRIYVPAAVVYHRIEGRELRLSTVLRRCFQGGFSGGLLQARFPTQMEAGGRRQGVLTLLAQTRSLQELACASVRAAGFFWGVRRRSSETG
jgi:glucosyl-dolichyl phosphate glucuronosyltransferase